MDLNARSWKCVGSYKTPWYPAGRLDVRYRQCELDCLKETQDRVIKEMCAFTQILSHPSFKLQQCLISPRNSPWPFND